MQLVEIFLVKNAAEAVTPFISCVSSVPFTNIILLQSNKNLAAESLHFEFMGIMILNKYTVLCVGLAIALPFAYCIPAGDKQTEQSPTSFGNLKFTFGSKDEIPAAFFESEVKFPSNSGNSGSSPSSPPNSARPVYRACQDGSGGMCVGAGTCPSNLKPETSDPSACSANEECCFGPPSTDKSCSSRGGECRARKECGSAPIAQDAQDCDTKNDQICCVLI